MHPRVTGCRHQHTAAGRCRPSLTTSPWWITPSPSATAAVDTNRGRDMAQGRLEVGQSASLGRPPQLDSEFVVNTGARHWVPRSATKCYVLKHSARNGGQCEETRSRLPASPAGQEAGWVGAQKTASGAALISAAFAGERQDRACRKSRRRIRGCRHKASPVAPHICIDE